MSNATYQKNVGLITIMTRRGESLEAIMTKTKMDKDTVEYWMNKVKRNMH